MTDALLVVDMINDFCHPDGKLYSSNLAAIIPQVRDYVEMAREQQRPIFYLCDTHLPDDPEFRIFPEHATSAWGRTPVDGIKAAWTTDDSRRLDYTRTNTHELLVPKNTFSGFYGTNLHSLLRARKAVTKLTVVGNCTDICVFFTAADARLRGYDVEVPKAAVATFREIETHNYALMVMEMNLGVKVV